MKRNKLNLLILCIGLGFCLQSAMAAPPVIGGGGGETDPDNPQIIAPIGDGYWILILLALIYIRCVQKNVV